MSREHDYLVEQYQLKHERDPSYGAGTMWHSEVRAFLAELGARTVLDYGCGKGGLVAALRRTRYVADGYDPAVPEFSDPPAGRYDVVTCLDVLEHLRREDVVGVLHRVEERAARGVFLAVSCRPAGHLLPDGRNCHETVEAPSWWRERIGEALPGWVLEDRPGRADRSHLFQLTQP